MARPRPHFLTEFSRITPQIFIGTNMCCSLHFTKLLKLGVTADISLEEKRAEKPENMKVFLWIPTKDHTAPSQEQLDAGVRTLSSVVENGMKAYVHCKHGHGRAPTLVAAYFIATKQVRPAEAVEMVKKGRPEIHLRASQMRALERYARHTRKHKRA
ncbi:dual specificity protein phosphatase family protein [Candidatus Azambacteria bacterium]|nr:dual specificity protein phosphatase family protein [Candidatus Azambacteria bacterium]MBI2587817.1 dual specificity protein phosphatase family protein [Candidatus Azambacteria bacterium]